MTEVPSRRSASVSGASSSSSDSREDTPIVMKCRACGGIVIGGHQDRAAHKASCPAAGATPSRPAARTRLKPLPVCVLCGKLFPTPHALDAHSCPVKSTSPPPPNATKSPFDESLDILRPCEMNPGRGLGRLQRFTRDNKALTEYETRMRRVLRREQLVDRTGHPTTQPVTPTPCIVCERCAKVLPKTVASTHATSSCVVTHVRSRLTELRALLAAAGDDTARGAVGRCAADASLDLPPWAAREQHITELAASIWHVTQSHAAIFDAHGAVLLPALPSLLPQLELDVAAWEARLAEQAKRTEPSAVVWSPGKRRPLPSLRSLVHDAPVIALIEGRKKFSTRNRASPTINDSHATDESADPFDADVLRLAAAVRRGELSLQEAAALPAGRVDRARVAPAYKEAIDPRLRH